MRRRASSWRTSGTAPPRTTAPASAARRSPGCCRRRSARRRCRCRSSSLHAHKKSFEFNSHRDLQCNASPPSEY
uniref:Uncharacterized protein n=1 Tax=Arundo donax TaxID=35708 RepID=A0A0A9BKR5_ARUDO